MEQLLNVKEAAEFLNVSEMTIRRWTNSGLLNCYRVGNRKARRFKYSDLINFLGETSKKSTPVAVALGIDGFAAPGDSHITHLSTDENEALDVAAAYVVKGLQDDETVCIVAPDGKTRRLMDVLQQKVENVVKCCTTGKLHLSQGAETPEQQIKHLLDLAAQTEGRLRVFGDMTWTRDKGWRMGDLTRLEKTFNQSPRPGGCLFLCQYALNTFSGRETMMAVETHTHSIYRGQIKENPYTQ